VTCIGAMHDYRNDEHTREFLASYLNVHNVLICSSSILNTILAKE